MYENQNQLVLAYLEKHYIIDNDKARNHLGIQDLQHAIMVLRKEGYPISDKWIKSINRWGKKVQYKEYKLERE